MTIHFQCDCGSSYHVKDEFAGRRARCAKCNNLMTVPQPATAKATDEDVLAALLAEEKATAPAPPSPGAADFHEPQEVRQPPRPPRLPPSLAAMTRDGEPAARSRPAYYERPRRRGPIIAVNSRLVTGLLMMVGAAVWFFVGLEAGIIFFYPPILFVIGLGTMFQGFGSDD